MNSNSADLKENLKYNCTVSKLVQISKFDFLQGTCMSELALNNSKSIFS